MSVHPHPDQDLRTALDGLSERATPGEWVTGDDGEGLCTLRDGNLEEHADALPWDAPFIVSLVNAYRSGLLSAAPPRPVDAERVEAWDGATLETRLRSYPAAPPGSDAMSCGYVSTLMTEAADALASPAHAPDKAVTREAVDGWKLMPPKPTDEMIRAARKEGIGVHSFTLAYEAAFALAPGPTGTEAGRGVVPAGWKLVPVEPTEAMWGGLARQIVMWSRQNRATGANLHRDLKNVGWPIPDWLGDEIEDADYVPPKGSVAVAIYRAMLAATPTPPVSPSPDSTGSAEAGYDDPGHPGHFSDAAEAGGPTEDLADAGDEQTTERAMMRIEAEADAWISETPDIGKMVKIIAYGWPPHLKDRAAAQADALVRQTFVEAFYRGFNAHRDHAAALAALTPSAPIADPSPDSTGQGDAETFETIRQWCEETFGPITNARTVERAREEFDELSAEPDNVTEAADVVIVLSRYSGLWAEVERKMKVNRARTWRLMGDGTGYHVKAASDVPGDAQTQEERDPTAQGANARRFGLLRSDNPYNVNLEWNQWTQWDAGWAQQAQTQEGGR